MSAYRTIELSRDARGVATLTLNRPDKRNALDATMISEFRVCLAELATDRQVRVVVLAANGNTFCGGADLGWMQELASSDRPRRIAQAAELGALLAELNTLPKPVIARVHASAYGGSVGILAACDSVIAAPEARFALTEVKLGLIPALIGPFVLARIGEAAARRLILSARTFDASEAHRAGLVSVLVQSSSELDTALENEIAPFLEGAPGAIVAAKRFLRDLAAGRLAETAERLADQLETDEARLGLANFLARQPPPWQRK